MPQLTVVWLKSSEIIYIFTDGTKPSYYVLLFYIHGYQKNTEITTPDDDHVAVSCNRYSGR